MKRTLLTFLIVLALGAVGATAKKPMFGKLYYNGDIVRTIIPPSAAPHGGVDNLYAIMDGAMGQLAVAGVAPGAPGYHGGQWAFHAVHWNTGVTPYLLKSESDVFAAESAGHVTVTRMPDKDFKCPVQP